MQKKMPKKEKYITEPVFEKHMGSVARSFTRIEERLDSNDKSFKMILNEIILMRQEAKEDRGNISHLFHSESSQERILKSLDIRVSRLEQKVK